MKDDAASRTTRRRASVWKKQAEKIAAFDRYTRPSDTKDADLRAIDPAKREEMVEAEYRHLGL